VRWLLEEGGSKAHECNHSGMTALLFAAYHGFIEMARYLLTKGGSSIAEKDNSDNTALIWAAYNGQIEMVKFLVLEAGSKVTEADKIGRPVLSVGAMTGHLPVLQWLVENGGADGPEMLLGATNMAIVWYRNHQNLDTVRWLLEKTLKVRNMMEPDVLDILNSGVISKSSTMLNFLLDYGFPANAQTVSVRYPLLYSMRWLFRAPFGQLPSNSELILLLLRKGGGIGARELRNYITNRLAGHDKLFRGVVLIGSDLDSAVPGLSEAIFTVEDFVAGVKRGLDIDLAAVRTCCHYLLDSPHLHTPPSPEVSTQLKSIAYTYSFLRPENSLLNICFNNLNMPEGRSIVRHFYITQRKPFGCGQLLPVELENGLIPPDLPVVDPACRGD
jgi:hypothetical protein